MTDSGSRLFDSGLQPERTALAWRRTGLALLGASLLVGRVLAESSVPLALVVGALGTGTAIALLLAVEGRYRSHHRRLIAAAGESIPLAEGRLPLLVAGVTVVLAAVGLLAVVLAALRLN